MNPRKPGKTSKMMLETLRERSKRGLKLARKTILDEKIGSPRIREALEYYTSVWEIFPHPGLFSIACEAVGGDPDTTVQIQAAISMMAAAFDIHDDIIDQSELKYGKPTVLGKFGKDVALLLGDAFLVEGFTLLAKSISESRPEKFAEILETLKTSLFELGSAHALELNLKGRTDTALEDYVTILKMKAASIEADMRIGATIGGGTSSEVETLTRYGRILGILAALREEFIDIFEVEELRQRISNEYLPIPVSYAMRNKQSKRDIQKLLSKKKITRNDIDKLVNIVFETKDVVKLRKMMDDLATESVQLISTIKNMKSRKHLRELSLSMLEDL